MIFIHLMNICLFYLNLKNLIIKVRFTSNLRDVILINVIFVINYQGKIIRKNLTKLNSCRVIYQSLIDSFY